MVKQKQHHKFFFSSLYALYKNLLKLNRAGQIDQFEVFETMHNLLNNKGKHVAFFLVTKLHKNIKNLNSIYF